MLRPAVAQSAAGVQRPQEFGPGCCNILQIPAASFMPRRSDVIWFAGYFGYWYGDDPTDVGFEAPVTLPPGAEILLLNLYFYDRSIWDLTATLKRYSGWEGSNVDEENVVSVSSVGSAGYGYATSDLISHTFNNDVRNNGGGQYAVIVVAPEEEDGSLLQFKGVEIWWRRQVSPAPLSATFGDVPASHPYFRFIEALYEASITSGCGGGNLCPDREITRGEMAVLLAKALGLEWERGGAGRP